MNGIEQLRFAEIAREAGKEPRTGKSRPEARGAIRGPSRGLRGAAAGTPPPRELKSGKVEKSKSDPDGKLKSSEVEKLPGGQLNSSKVEQLKSSEGRSTFQPFNPSTFQPAKPPFNRSTPQPFNRPAAAAEPAPPRPKLVAAIYAEEADEKGNLRLRKVTTSRWLTVRQVADTLGVVVQTVYLRIEMGDLTAHRIGNAIRIASDDFEKYLRRTRTDAEFREE